MPGTLPHTPTADLPPDSPQPHLFRFWSSLSDDEKRALVAQVESINLNEIGTLWQSAPAESDAALADKASAPSSLIPATIRTDDPQRFAQAEATGWQALAEGRVGAILVAGGEGTRLGFPHPKGQYPIGPVSKKSLFQWLAEQLLAVSQRAGVPIPYYIMTSDATHEETVAFFREHHYFGLNADHVRFFRQGNMPAVDQKSGHLLLGEKHRVAVSPDGHGGLLAAFDRAGLFDDVLQRGVEYLFYHQVDNPLARVCDPAFIGFHRLHNAEVSTKIVAKEDPAEKVGLLVEVDGRHRIIEYIDVPPHIAQQTDQSGKLRLRCGNIAVHLFNATFLQRVARENGGLPYHRSSKPVPYVDESGTLAQPTSSNAFKFEKFIFDILPATERALAMEIVRDDEFVPLKNREGQFSPDHVRSAMRQLHTRWLRNAGWTTEQELPVEIPPAAALCEADFLNPRVPPAR